MRQVVRAADVRPVSVTPPDAQYGDVPRRAKQGDVSAEYQMGMLHSRNAAHSSDASMQAYQWFSRAASKGHPRAQYNLGVMYAQGDGMVQNLVEAYIWFNLASAQHMEGAAQARDMVAASLTSDALMKAQDRSSLYHQRIAQNVAKMHTGDMAGIVPVQ
jgi:TPR repeat protein